MTIPSDLAAQVLARSGRRCCVCRRFRPLRLQVHHIVPAAEGGADDIDNLITLCLTCHSSVHSEVPFTRRFSAQELKIHRDNLYKLVENGTLPAPSEPQVPSRPAEQSGLRGVLQRSFPDHAGLIPAAAEILVAAATGDGEVLFIDLDQGPALTAGKKPIIRAGLTPRTVAEYRAGFDQLVASRLLRRLGPRSPMYEVTHPGYLLADELIAAEVELNGSDGE